MSYILFIQCLKYVTVLIIFWKEMSRVIPLSSSWGCSAKLEPFSKNYVHKKEKEKAEGGKKEIETKNIGLCFESP